MTDNTAETLREIFKRDSNEKWFPEKNERFVAAILEVLLPERQAIVRSSIVAFNEGRHGIPYHPGYTEHEGIAWGIGRKWFEDGKK